MSTKSIKIFGLALGTVFLIALGLVAFRPAPPPPPLPNPNGYDDFLAADKLVVGDALNLYDVKDEELRTIVGQNRAALQAVRQGLTKECQMPLTNDAQYLSQETHHLIQLRKLAFQLIGEGKLAEIEGRRADAVQSYLDEIRFGQEVGRGGLMVEKLLGIACERVGLSVLQGLAPKLSSEESSKLTKALEEIDGRRERWEAVLRRQKAFTRRMGNFLGITIVQLLLRDMLREGDRKFREEAKTAEARLRLLMTDLAIRQFQGERGVYPSRLAELVPEFLKALPRDPFGTNGFIYRTQTNGFLLYSVGPDGKDDGGTPIAARGKSGDIPSSTLGLPP
jgi:hypothetical protein